MSKNKGLGAHTNWSGLLKMHFETLNPKQDYACKNPFTMTITRAEKTTFSSSIAVNVPNLPRVTHATC